ncbi:MAG: lysine 2,3-aminomutase [Deltaproteobacteria bacterium]|nr:lysine 2,3-aminomutase [Deltaproteobacteria bacterium]
MSAALQPTLLVPERRRLLELAELPWRAQLRHIITEPEQLAQYVPLSDREMAAIRQAAALFPMAITPYYASLMDPDDPRCPIRKQAVPSRHELVVERSDLADPLAEEADSPVEGLTHRYPDRVLLLASNHCAVFCRHCTRKRRVGDPNRAITRRMLERAFDYIARTPAIRDVLVSGGDPLMLPDERLDWILGRIRAIRHVEVVRLGTRVPVVLPQRITPELVAMLRRHQPLWLNTHFNHPRELTSESTQALEMLADGGIPLGNQSVLLRDVNDCPLVMRDLVQGLVRRRVRPYYLYQCDLSRGIEHFRTPVSKGIEIMEMLRGHTSGFAVPTYVVDAPGGGGKIPVMPNYLISMAPRRVVLRNFEGVFTVYHEPAHHETSCPPSCDHCDQSRPRGERWCPEVGVGKLFNESSSTISLVPTDLPRHERRGAGSPSPAE